MRRRLFWVAALTAACVAAASAVMLELTTEDLVSHASLVVVGTVENVKSYPPDGAGMIYSEAKVRVGDAVVGATAEGIVTVRYMGGEYGDLGVVVEDQPTFDPGEDVVLFLAPATGGSYVCPDGVQSKYAVVDGTVLPAGVTLNEFLAEITKAAAR
jgi:hypothetical protein